MFGCIQCHVIDNMPELYYKLINSSKLIIKILGWIRWIEKAINPKLTQPMLKWIPTSSWKTNLKCWVGLGWISFIGLMGWMHVLVIPFCCCLPICERTLLWLMFTVKQNDNILSCCVLKITTSYMDCVRFVKLWFKKACYAIYRRQNRMYWNTGYVANLGRF